MARRGSAKPREISADPIFKNKLISKLVNRSMRDGKKSVVQKEVYRAFDIINEKTG